jgi:N-acetylated-alpha-linked acidic dipeptidase
MLEEAKSIGNLLKSGWKPDRTIIYCAWDGEEPGLLGSTEWVEAHEKELKEKAIVYVNTDSNGRGFFYAAGSQALEPFMDEIAKQVIDPQTKVSIFERRKDNEAISAKTVDTKKKIWDEKELKLEALGSGSDYSSFLQHEGIPSLNLAFGGEDEGGEYHSIYDSYSLYAKFKDPGFQYGVTLAETAGHAILRMSCADGLAFDFTHLYNTIDAYSNELMALLKTSRESTELENQIILSGAYAAGDDPTKGYSAPRVKPEVPFLDFSTLQNAVRELKISVDSLNVDFQNKLKTNSFSVSFNQSLYRAEQQLLNESGLPRRTWYKHTLYAPGSYTGYGVKTMPGIREAIEQRNWKEAQQQIETDSRTIIKLADYFKSMSVSGK